MNSAKRSLFQRMERRLIGLVMVAMAYGLEKAVLRSIRRGGRKDPSIEPPLV